MLDAQELFTQTWVRTENKWSAAFSFRRIAQLGLPHATEQLLAENVQLALGFLTEPEYERIFVDQGKFLEVAGGLDGIGKTLTDKQVVDFVAAVDAASLVFHHSLVDSAALDYCRVTALVVCPHTTR